MKYLFFSVTLFIAFLASAQRTITDKESVLVYSLPKTVLEIKITAEKVIEKPGQFYQYSERYLATTDVITTEKTYYRLKGIAVSTTTVPDSARTFTIIPNKKSLTSKIAVTEQGLLCGINVMPVSESNKNNSAVNFEIPPTATTEILPLSEEYMLAGSVAKMAEGAAKQIYRIRESRADLLSGDADNIPKDGTALKAMITQMDTQEKALTELFTGKITTESLTQTLEYVPVSAVENEVIFRFSSYSGLTDKDDLSGSPYYITISYDPIKTIPSEKKKKKEEEIFSVLPVTAQVTMSNGAKNIYQKEIILPQLGVLVPMPLDTMDKYSKAYINPETGRLLSVEQMPKNK